MVWFRVQTALNIQTLEKQTYVRQLDYIRKVGGGGGGGHMPEKKIDPLSGIPVLPPPC